MTLRKIGERLAEARKERGLLQWELAEIIGTSTTKIADVERGTFDGPVYLRFVRMLCEFYGIDYEKEIIPIYREYVRNKAIFQKRMDKAMEVLKREREEALKAKLSGLSLSKKWVKRDAYVVVIPGINQLMFYVNSRRAYGTIVHRFDKESKNARLFNKKKQLEK